MVAIMEQVSPSVPTKRIIWIDVFRVLGMILIMATHMGCWEWITLNVFNSSLVYFFFFLAALLTKNTDWTSTLKRASTLLVPYFIWRSIELIVHCWSSGDFSFSFPTWASIDAVYKISDQPVMGILWFLRALIIFSLLTPLIVRINRYALLLICIIAMMVSICNQPKLGGLDNLARAWFFNGLVLYIAGVWCRRDIGLPEFLAWCTRYAKHLFFIGIFSLIIQVSLMQILPMIGKMMQYSLSYISLPMLLIYLSQRMPLLVEKIANLAPAVFFIFVSHGLFLAPYHAGRMMLEANGYASLAVLFQATAPLLLFAGLAGVYYIFRKQRLIAKYFMLR